MIVTNKENLIRASKGGYAIPAINTQEAISTLSGLSARQQRN